MIEFNWKLALLSLITAISGTTTLAAVLSNAQENGFIPAETENSYYVTFETDGSTSKSWIGAETVDGYIYNTTAINGIISTGASNLTYGYNRTDYSFDSGIFFKAPVSELPFVIHYACAISTENDANAKCANYRFTLNDDDTYTISKQTKLITGQTTLVIPAYYNGKAVTKLADSLFSGNHQFKQVYIPDTITYIGNYMFDNDEIQSLYIPSSVTYIGSSLFVGCQSLRTVNCGATAQPSTWANSWDYYSQYATKPAIAWGVSRS